MTSDNVDSRLKTIYLRKASRDQSDEGKSLQGNNRMLLFSNLTSTTLGLLKTNVKSEQIKETSNSKDGFSFWTLECVVNHELVGQLIQPELIFN